jgi:flagellin
MARIVTNSSANTVFKNLMKNNMALASSTEKLATGLRINRASDDPGLLGVSELMRGQVRGTSAALDNLQNANSFLNTVDGYLQTAHDILGRMRELIIRYGDGSLSSNDKGNLQTEFNALKAEAGTTIMTNAKYNGQNINAEYTFTVDADGNTQANVGSTTIATAGTNTAALLITGTVAAVDAEVVRLSTARADVGSDQSRINFKLSSQANYLENIAAAEGVIRNVDMAQESTKFSRNQILVQSSTAMLAQANAASQNVLSLLR